MSTSNGLSMTCDDASVALMLRTDPEAVKRAERHQARCDVCTLAPRDADEDVPDSAVRAIPRPPRPLLIALLGLGLCQAAVAIPWMLGSDPFGLLGSTVPPTHATRDGAMGLAVAVAAIMAGLRPRWARPGFTIAGSLIIAQAIAGIVDNSIVDTGPAEAIHLVSVVLAVLIGACVITQILAPLGPRRRHRLRSVDPER